ncbi:MAG: ankyrin repeat domain-containing protein, partial [Clostridiales bacterium]|nr:ankyrin repeat domain-containing protein [Clostridiales bacterium]
MNEKIIEIMETENISALKELINDELDISTDRVKTSVYLELLETLFTNNFDINLVNEQGVTPLMMASYNIDRPLVKFLLNQGADVNMKNKDGYTALIEVLDNPILMEEGFTGDLKEIIKMLIKGGADLNISPRDSEATILGIVALLGDYELCKYFIDKGADVNFGIIPPLMTLSMNMQFLSTLSKFSQEI